MLLKRQNYNNIMQSKLKFFLFTYHLFLLGIVQGLFSFCYFVLLPAFKA